MIHFMHCISASGAVGIGKALLLKPVAISKDGWRELVSDQEYNSCFCYHLHLMNLKDLAGIKRPKESSWTKDPPFRRVPYCSTVTFVCFGFFFKTMQFYIPQCIHLSHITPCVHIRNIDARRSCLPVCPADCF